MASIVAAATQHLAGPIHVANPTDPLAVGAQQA